MAEGFRAPSTAGKAPAQVSGVILLVDDESDILTSFKQFLEMSLPQVKVLTADSGEAGLKVLESNKVQLIISDYKMPGMNGLEFLRAAADVAHDVPRILITAFPKLDLAIQAINVVSVDRFLTKPIQPEQMLDAVRTLMAQK